MRRRNRPLIFLVSLLRLTLTLVVAAQPVLATAVAAVPCGDVNGDGVVNIGDALVVAQFDVGLRQCGVAPFIHPEVCDVNGDGACNIGDALRMAQCDVGLISCAFTCGAFTCPSTTSTTTSTATTTSSTTTTSTSTTTTSLVLLSTDPYTNPTSQHQTEVEPDTFAFGNTVVSPFQVGRFFDGGASNIGFATSIDGGNSFADGFLPGTTPFSTPAGIYARVSDASVAFDANHAVWIISYLGIVPAGNTSEVDVLVSRSMDGGLTWGNPVVVKADGDFNDKNWTVCDNTTSSPFYGNCYTEFDDATLGDLIQMSTSPDGGLTWGPALATADGAHGIGGQPLVQPSGRVVVPIVGLDSPVFTISSFISTNGGASWSSPVLVSEADFHAPNGGLRAGVPLPSAETDKTGKAYVVWSDCRFELGCNASDLVLSTSTDGLNWTSVKRIPIAPVGSGFDVFIPGLAVAQQTAAAPAQLALTFYYYPEANCTPATCQLDVGFISSTDGGTSWSKEVQLAGPTQLAWLANTDAGVMVGDYISTSIIPSDGLVLPVFALASLPNGGTLHEATYTTPRQVVGLFDGTNPLESPPTLVVPGPTVPIPAPTAQ